MGKVLGVGGVFFKAQDVEVTRDWYARVLGIEAGEHGAMFPPLPPNGMTIWSPFKADTTYFAPSDAPVMINLFVEDLDGLLERVRAEGVEVLGTQDESYGRFAWIMDPTGLKLELWEAAAESETPAT